MLVIFVVGFVFFKRIPGSLLIVIMLVPAAFTGEFTVVVKKLRAFIHAMVVLPVHHQVTYFCKLLATFITYDAIAVDLVMVEHTVIIVSTVRKIFTGFEGFVLFLVRFSCSVFSIVYRTRLSVSIQ